MLPVVLGDPQTVAERLRPTLLDLSALAPEHEGEVGYLTVDQKEIAAGQSHRRRGLHVDGYWRTGANVNAGVWGGGGGVWGGSGKRQWHEGSGMILVSDVVGCRAWRAEIDGDPDAEGDCEKFREILGEGEVLLPGAPYWLSPGCVHESVVQTVSVKRTVVRLSLPSSCDWYEGYTESEFGVAPTGRIRPRREFMEV